MIIAMDGPAGAGKSTISRMLAEALGFVRLDTGALYRAVALAAIRAGVPSTDGPRLAALLDDLDLGYDGSVWLDGENVDREIRSPEASAAASEYAAVPEVRAGLLALQRRLGRARDTILDGRDIGTVVFPDADVKIFLTASASARAGRRHAELVSTGHEAELAVVLAEIVARDKADMERAVAPLRQAEDAVLVDATHLNPAEVVAACRALVAAAR
jgi:cytidylate kinase